jgi:hypothetical protein
MDTTHDKGLLITGGICAILWPILSELLFYSLYHVLAGGSNMPLTSNLETFLRGTAELSHNQAILSLEWSKVATPLLLLPFLLALCRYLDQQGQRNLILVAVGLGLLSIVYTMIGHTFNSSVNHALGQAYVAADSDAAVTNILSIARVFSAWHLGINQTASLLYQGCVGLISIALVRRHTWRFWGWLGLIGALLAIPAKLPLSWPVPTNFIWTGIAYFIWPVGLGIALIKAGKSHI